MSVAAVAYIIKLTRVVLKLVIELDCDVSKMTKQLHCQQSFMYCM